MQPRMQSQWEFSIEDRTSKNGSNKAKKSEEQPAKAFFTTLEASKKRTPAKF